MRSALNPSVIVELVICLIDQQDEIYDKHKSLDTRFC